MQHFFFFKCLVFLTKGRKDELFIFNYSVVSQSSLSSCNKVCEDRRQCSAALWSCVIRAGIRGCKLKRSHVRSRPASWISLQIHPEVVTPAPLPTISLPTARDIRNTCVVNYHTNRPWNWPVVRVRLPNPPRRTWSSQTNGRMIAFGVTRLLRVVLVFLQISLLFIFSCSFLMLYYYNEYIA